MSVPCIPRQSYTPLTKLYPAQTSARVRLNHGGGVIYVILLPESVLCQKHHITPCRLSHSLPAVNDRDTCRRLARHINRSAASIRCFRARNPAFKELVRAIAANGHATDPIELGEGGGGDKERDSRGCRQVRPPRMSNKVDSGVDSGSAGNFENFIDKLFFSRFSLMF